MNISLLKSKIAYCLKNSLNALLFVTARILWLFAMPNNPKRICIHRVGQIGDIICAIPAMKAIRKKFPSAHITLLTSPGDKNSVGAKELLGDTQWINKLHVYYRNDLNSIPKIFRFAMQLRKEKFDLWIQLPQDLTNFRTELRNMIFVRLVGVSFACGFYVNTLKIFKNDQLKNQKFISEIELQLNHLKKIKIDADEIDFDIGVHENEKNYISSLLKQYNLDGYSLLAVAPGGKRLSNRWPAERFAEIAKRWVEKGGKVVVLGGTNDFDLGEAVRSNTKDTVNLCGKTTLLGSLELLKKCSLMLSNDTGSMHLAASAGTKCVVVFSSRDFPVKWYPWGKDMTIIRKDVPCSLCMKDVCFNDNLCMTLISVDEIWEAIKSKNG